jgi:hypothetical protein
MRRQAPGEIHDTARACNHDGLHLGLGELHEQPLDGFRGHHRTLSGRVQLRTQRRHLPLQQPEVTLVDKAICADSMQHCRTAYFGSSCASAAAAAELSSSGEAKSMSNMDQSTSSEAQSRSSMDQLTSSDAQSRLSMDQSISSTTESSSDKDQ